MIEKTQTHNDLLASLVDIRDVRIDRTLPMEERVKSNQMGIRRCLRSEGRNLLILGKKQLLFL